MARRGSRVLAPGGVFVGSDWLRGEEEAAHRLQSGTLKRQALEDGFLRPTHFVGFKSV